MTDYLSKQDRKKVESFLNIGTDVVLGNVNIDTEKCTGCQFCVNACAASSLEVSDGKSRMVEKLPVCIACGDCVAICPEQAITIERFISFNHFFRFLDRGESMPPRRF